MAPVTMKDDALPQIHLVRDTDLGVFAYELHILAGDFLRSRWQETRAAMACASPLRARLTRGTPLPPNTATVHKS